MEKFTGCWFSGQDLEDPSFFPSTGWFHDHFIGAVDPKPVATSDGAAKSCKQTPTIFPESTTPILLSFDGFSANADVGNARSGCSGKRAASTVGVLQDHIVAERKRREKLTQRFIALSAVIPGLKKVRITNPSTFVRRSIFHPPTKAGHQMDKVSVLGDAVKYVKQLQEKVKDLEARMAKPTAEPVVLVKKSQLPADEDSFDDLLLLPQIEAKVFDRNVLLRVNCEKRKGLLAKLLAEMERFDLSVVNTSVVPFAGSVLDVTIVAQMEEGFSTTVGDLVMELKSRIWSNSS